MYWLGFKQLWGYIVKVTVIVSVLLVLLGIFLHSVQDAMPKVDTSNSDFSDRQELYTFLNNPDYQKTTTAKLTVGSIRGILCFSAGEACTNNPNDAYRNFNSSVFGRLSGLTTIALANPPSSGAVWVVNSMQNAGFIPKTYAAGIGFYSLGAYQKIWDAFRQVTYFLLVAVIVVVGFMVMFRFKINPQTVVAVETALPRIVITLLLITFSYAIAGFLVDITYLIIFFIFEIFSHTGLFSTQELATQYLNSSIFGSSSVGAFSNGLGIYMQGLFSLYSILPGALRGALNAAFFLLSAGMMARITGWSLPIFSSILGKLQVGGNAGIVVVGGSVIWSVADFLAALASILLGSFLAPVLISLLFLLIAIFGLFILYFRIFFFLLGAYVQIIVHVMFAPIFILPQAISGQNSFINWMKTLMGYLLIFPLTILFLILIVMIQRTASVPNAHIFSMPLLDNLDTRGLATVVSAVMLLSIPELVRSYVKKMIGETQLPASAGSLFAPAGAGLGVAGTLYGLFHQFAVTAPHIGEATWLGGKIKPLADKMGIKMK